jgi:neutral ceramidase
MMNRVGGWLVVAVILGLLMMVGEGNAAEAGRLRAGAATSNITLPVGASMGGVIARGGPVLHIHDELHARCLVLDDGSTRLAFVLCDLRMVGRPVVEEAKRLVHQATGLPPEHLLIAATHTHAAPAVIGIHTSEIDRVYGQLLVRRIADSVQRAIRNLAPARVGWGSVSVPRHVFNRRWFMKEGTIPANPFGSRTDRVRMNPPRGSEDLLRPAGPVDPEVFVLSVEHADGRPLALLANYGLHYVGGYQAGHVSADYFGIFARRVGELLKADRQEPAPGGCGGTPPSPSMLVGILSNGTSGDVNNIDFRKRRLRVEPWVKMGQVADDLAQEVVRVQKKIEHQDRLTLAAASVELHLGVRKPDEARLAWARKVMADVKNPKRMTRPEIYASEALALARFPDKVPVELLAFRIGPLGIAGIPCEVFAETGLALKKESALKPCFTIELANGYNGYLPTPAQHELGGYETWPARSAYLEKEAEPRIRKAVLGLMDRLGM